MLNSVFTFLIKQKVKSLLIEKLFLKCQKYFIITLVRKCSQGYYVQMYSYRIGNFKTILLFYSPWANFNLLWILPMTNSLDASIFNKHRKHLICVLPLPPPYSSVDWEPMEYQLCINQVCWGSCTYEVEFSLLAEK